MRIKRGQNKNRKHKKVLKLAKGYRLSYSKLYRRALEAVKHAGVYNYIHRKHKKGQKRTEWIKSISAALATENISYSKFIAKLKANKIELDRKLIADMAIDHPEHFSMLVKEVSK